MWTTGPAARPTRAFDELRAYPLNVVLARFGLLDGGHPANPFIPGKRGNVFPGSLRLGRRKKCLAQIRRYRMQRAGGESIFAHWIMITKWFGRLGIVGGKNQVDRCLSDFPLISLDKKLTSIPFRVLVGSSTPLHYRTVVTTQRRSK